MASARGSKYAYLLRTKILYSRYVNYSSRLFNQFLQYSTSVKKNDRPIKFSETPAYKLSIDENLQIAPKNSELWYQPYVIVGSVFILLLYFCVLREENDIDEMLKTNPEYESEYTRLIRLQIELQYCKQNNLPTEALIEKITNIKNKLGIKNY